MQTDETNEGEHDPARCAGSELGGAHGYAHCCQHVGLVMDATHIKQLPDGTYEARAKIVAIFGAEVEGECKGKGATKEEALAALAKHQHEIHESMWA